MNDVTRKPDDGDDAPSRDVLRAKLLASVRRKNWNVRIRGVELEIRQPMMAEMLQNRPGRSPDASTAHSLAYFLIDNAFIPGTEIKVFEEGDVDTILNTWMFDEEVTGLTRVMGEMTGGTLEQNKEDLRGDPTDST